jgi:hypothetical protein
MKKSKKLSISEPSPYAGGWCPVCNTSGPPLALNWFRCDKCRKLVCPNCIKKVGKKLVCLNCSPSRRADSRQPIIGSPVKKEYVRIILLAFLILTIVSILISFSSFIFQQSEWLYFALISVILIFLSALIA